MRDHRASFDINSHYFYVDFFRRFLVAIDYVDGMLITSPYENC